MFLHASEQIGFLGQNRVGKQIDLPNPLRFSLCVLEEMRDLQGEENKMLLKDAFFYILWEILFLYNKFFLFIFYIINFCINQLIF